MNDKEKDGRIEKIKAHVKEHKREYAIRGLWFVGGILVTGAAAAALDRAQIINIQAIIGKNTVMTNNIIAKFGDPKGKPGIRSICVENGQPYESIRDASKKLHVNTSIIAAHLRGELEDAEGLHLINMGPALVPEGATSPQAA